MTKNVIKKKIIWKPFFFFLLFYFCVNSDNKEVFEKTEAVDNKYCKKKFYYTFLLFSEYLLILNKQNKNWPNKKKSYFFLFTKKY